MKMEKCLDLAWFTIVCIFWRCMYAQGIDFDFRDVQGITVCNLWVVIYPIVVSIVLPFKNHWTYDHARSIRRGDNLNKETLKNTSDSAHGHSPIIRVGKSVWGEKNPNNRLDASILDRGPYPVDDPVPPTWEQAQQRSCPLMREFPVNRAISRVGNMPQQNMYVCMYSSTRRFRWGESIGLPATSGRNPISGTDGGSKRKKFLQQSGGLRVGKIPQRRISTPVGWSRKAHRQVRVPTPRYGRVPTPHYGTASDTTLWISSGEIPS